MSPGARTDGGQRPKTDPAFPLPCRLRGRQPAPPAAGSPWALGCCRAPCRLPGVPGVAGGCSGEGGVAELFLCEPFVCGLCVCLRRRGRGRGMETEPGTWGAGEGFLPFCIFVIREKRNFYGYFYGWSVPRTWSICFTKSPLPASLGGTTVPVDWGGSARQPLRLRQHRFLPSPLLAPLPLALPPCSSTCVSGPSFCLASLSTCRRTGPTAGPLCPPMGPPCPPSMSQNRVPVRA